MVEQSEHNANDNNDDAPKRRGRLFGGRRARSGQQTAGGVPTSTDAVETTGSPEPSAPEPTAAETTEPVVTDSVSVQVDVQTGATAVAHDVSTLTGDLPVVDAEAVAAQAADAEVAAVAEAAGADDAPETAVADAAALADELATPPQQTDPTQTDTAQTDTAQTDTAQVAPVTTTDAALTASTTAAARNALRWSDEDGDTDTDDDTPTDSHADAPATDETAEPATAAVEAPKATSTLSLIFHAPVLPEIPVRGARSDRDDRWDEDDDQESGSRRRTRRRGSSADREPREPRDHQEPRRREVEYITEPQKVKGSTRLEAKKQRRRDGRDAGRRRQVVTEDEFLARRESVDRQMIVRSSAEKIEIGVIEDNVLAEHYVTKSHNVSLIGNVYLGKVQNVLPSMEAAFVDIGRGRNAVLYAGEVDWNSVETGNHGRRIEAALKPGDKVLVQVTKDPVGHKGARLTSQVSLPGRYLVYVPNGSMNGISRKLPDTERARLKKILKAVLPEHAGVIVRTAAEGATEEQLTRDVQRLTAQWEAIQKKVAVGQAPVMLHSEPDLLVKIVRDVFNEDFTKLIIDGDAARETIEEYLDAVAPDLKDRVELYDGPDSFEEHRLNEQVEKALDRKVWLPSGGSLVIDRTEAMTVVDVNTGKFVGSGGNLEETVTKNNLEAAEEIVRQLRLRDIGGIIVVDFIDMVLESNRDLVLRRLVECLSRDRTKHQVAEVTSLGLVQMTRKKIGVGLRESLDEVNAKVNDNNADPGPSKGRRKGRGNGSEGTSSAGGNTRGNGNFNGHGNGSGSGSNGPGGEQKPSQAHQITEDVKHALSRIAASTIGHEEPAASPTTPESSSSPASAPAAPAASAASAAPAATDAPEASTEGGPKRRRRRGGRASSEQSAPASTDGVLTLPAPAAATAAPAIAPTERTAETTAAPATPVASAPDTTAPAASAPEQPAQPTTPPARRRASSSATVTPADTTVAILDIPVAVTKREPRKAPDADSLLDSVLQALPEPKQPGQGRSRSRRVSSGSISAPATTDGDASDDGTVILGS
ncbi:Rne/Rng family ribonuclease [Curtobacterium sp. VKM Ac-1395]|uniref:Rne/Rng family ribonuclease n=1 Tax=Curtobacterium sp. VKM Ac-1395 TaxID=2783815 RepID=UPI00188CF437|nr:Rne/Rng family ribonuclease [Curtobacterium sp. VKM Ac-1395]MBF4590059.1 Rne/Rng family ribonuclease [Curtobacterium sp. VKM Ac-1395]